MIIYQSKQRKTRPPCSSLYLDLLTICRWKSRPEEKGMGSFFSVPAAAAYEEGESAVVAVHSDGEWTQNWQAHSQTNKLVNSPKSLTLFFSWSMDSSIVSFDRGWLLPGCCFVSSLDDRWWSTSRRPGADRAAWLSRLSDRCPTSILTLSSLRSMLTSCRWCIIFLFLLLYFNIFKICFVYQSFLNWMK